MDIGKRVELDPMDLEYIQADNVLVGLVQDRSGVMVAVQSGGKTYAGKLTPTLARQFAADMLNLVDEVEAANGG